MLMDRVFGVCVLVAASFAMTAADAVQADFMLDHVPDDAMLYFGWQGTDAMGEAFEQSHFGSVRRDTNVDQVVVGLLPIAGMFLGEHAGQIFRLITQLERVLWQRPWVMFVGDPASVTERLGAGPDVAVPTLRIGIIVKPGQHDRQVRQALQQWERAMTDDNTPATWIDDGERLGLMVGYDEQQVRDIHIVWRSLSRDTHFSHARRQVMNSPALLAYINIKRVARRIGDGAPLPGLMVDPSHLDAFITELDLNGMQRAVYAGGFQQRLWQGQLFVDAPAPRQGLARLFDAEPINDRELRAIPRSASWLSAYRLDAQVILNAVDNALHRLHHEADPVNAEIRKALTAGLGELWLFYSDPTFISPAGPGVSLVHQLRDGRPIEAVMPQLVEQLNGHDPEQPAVEQTQRDGMTIYQYTTPSGNYTFAWAIASNRLYVGTSVQTVAAAHAHTLRPGNALPQSSQFQRVRERLGNPPAGARLAFADLQSTAPSMFQGYAHAMQLNLGGLDMGPNLPNLRRLMPYLIPAGKSGWADDRGWHARSIEPFPGANLLSPSATINLGTGTLAATILFSVTPATAAGP
ncbi:hypothetical protein ACERK3_10810 [Phycisphaerales bacterium AB-hyl4]|uniref:Uncharacterized protein n=1 Tax=Natronomicrosphaera hydrolytica TaxID=3242702 RepID=A0ABV4U5B9_9BACT